LNNTLDFADPVDNNPLNIRTKCTSPLYSSSRSLCQLFPSLPKGIAVEAVAVVDSAAAVVVVMALAMPPAPSSP
jgi:hypothetical protein